MQLEDFIWFQNFTIFDYLFCIATKLKFDIIVELQWHNRLARRTYRQYLPHACCGRVMRRLRVRASPGASVFDWPFIRHNRTVRTSIPYFLTSVVFFCYWKAFYMSVSKQRNEYISFEETKSHKSVLRNRRGSNSRPSDCSVCEYETVRCLLRYRGTYIKLKNPVWI